jgi:DNA helicase II / ATP-dependent DNA helicase PcrA
MLSQKLNPQQLEAVQYSEGPLMVVAGAGSGKTRVIANRIAYLIQEKEISPENILAITFTNKAAAEMLERVRTMLDPSYSFWISTFHSFCLKILRLHIATLGYKNDFVIYDRQDQLSVVKHCMKNLKFSEEVFPPKTMIGHIGDFKNKFILPEDIDLNGFSYDTRLKAGELYPHYQKALQKNNALDFDDLLILSVQLFEKDASIREYYNNRFTYLLVDEFQDTNAAQYRLVKVLTKKHQNVCVVGDDDQSIYRWRGANIENIFNFEKDFPGTKLIKLEENYRSTKTILKAAGELVKENLHRKPKTLWTQNETGEPIQYIQSEDETDEAQTVCDIIKRINEEEGISLTNVAVLYRTNAQSRAVEDVLRKLRLPYQVVGGLKFYERKEIKDVLAYLRLVINPDDSVSLKRIINVPARGIGKTSLEKIDAWSVQKGIPFLEGLRTVEREKIVSTGIAKKINQFIAMVDRFDTIYKEISGGDFLRAVIEESGYMAMLEKEVTPENRSRLENLKELCSAVDLFIEKEKNGTLKEFLDQTSLAADIDNYDEERGCVHLMTLHTCKGLEFEFVFIVGMENRILPHVNSMGSSEEYEEERRLCYVGFTRARKKLWLSNAKKRRLFGGISSNQPSEFIDSIPYDLIKKIPGLASAGSSWNTFEGSTQTQSPQFTPSISKNSNKPYPIGSKVIHPKFGPGVIIKREGNEDNLNVVIFFSNGSGKKTLSVKHANLIVV